MGGTVGLTIRLASGKEYRMARWTNMLPWAFKNINLLTGKPKHIKDIINSWDKMVLDYANHKKTGEKFKYPMTDSYVSEIQEAALCPISYGLVVLDLKTKTILDLQGYSSLNYMDIYSASNLIHRNEKDDGYHIENEKDKENAFWSLLKLIQAGKITQLRKYDPKKGIVFSPFDEKLKLELETKEGLSKFLIAHTKTRGDTPICGFVIDMSPFTYVRFEESKVGALTMLKAVKDLGFKLSDKEVKKFKGWK